MARYRFFPLKLGKIQIFSGLPRVFSYTVLIHTDFFPKLLIFMVFYTDLCQIIVAGLRMEHDLYFDFTFFQHHTLLGTGLNTESTHFKQAARGVKAISGVVHVALAAFF